MIPAKFGLNRTNRLEVIAIICKFQLDVGGHLDFAKFHFDPNRLWGAEIGLKFGDNRMNTATSWVMMEVFNQSKIIKVAEFFWLEIVNTKKFVGKS